MRLIVLPGVFKPISDTHMLAEAVGAHVRPGHTSALDLCTGSGAIALAAAKAGSPAVCAVDISRAAVVNARLNARLNGVEVDARRGDLFAPFDGERFDLIMSNPPYVPAGTERLPTSGKARAWEAGLDGRALLDRICAEVPKHLSPGGMVLLIHSSVCDGDETLERLRRAGLSADVVARARGPLGPLMSARFPQRKDEELLVIRGLMRSSDERGP